MPKEVQPAFILGVEKDELFIQAGLQDRVIQVLFPRNFNSDDFKTCRACRYFLICVKTSIILKGPRKMDLYDGNWCFLG